MKSFIVFSKLIFIEFDVIMVKLSRKDIISVGIYEQKSLNKGEKQL